MYNKKKYSFGSSHPNEGYEPEKDEVKMKRQPNSVSAMPDNYGSTALSDLDDFISDMENSDMTLNLGSLGPSKKISSESTGHHGLEGISEEINQNESSDLYSPDTKNLFQGKESSESNEGKMEPKVSAQNLREDRMSLSNFKKINMGYIPDEENETSNGIKRDVSYGSEIQMKEIHSDIHTGKRYRKCSALIVTPKVSDVINPYDVNDDHINIKVLEDSRMPQLFIEFDILQINPMTNSYCWMEKSRWLRFEEDYDLDLKRFNNPHLSAMSLRGLTGFRKCFKKGDAILNCQSERYTDILKTLSDKITKSGDFSLQEIGDIRNALALRHYHAGEYLTSSPSDISMYRYDYEKQCFESNDAPRNPRDRKWSMASLAMYDPGQRRVSRSRLNDRLNPNTEALSVQVGALDSLKQIFSVFVRLDPPIKVDGLNEVNCPVRFIYILFGPKLLEDDLFEVGRVFSIMMSNPEFREIGYSAETKEEILDATKAFLNHSVIVPLTKVITNDVLSSMLPQLKQYSSYFSNEQNKKTFEEFKKEIYTKNQEIVVNQRSNGVNRKFSLNPNSINHVHLTENNNKLSVPAIITPDEKEMKTSKKIKICCKQFFPPFKHILLDVRGLKQRYPSDFKDAFLSENVPIVFIGLIFIYFVVLSPAITFGALFNQLISKKMSVSMCLVSSGFFQFVYTLFSGQPLEVVGITGPVYVVERVLGSLSVSLAIELEVMRFWIGIYVSILGFLFSMFNGVLIIQHFRRSVEEVYNFFVGIIFILSALFTMFKRLPYSFTPIVVDTNITIVGLERFQFGHGGTTLFLAFLMLNFCLLLVQIKRGSYFRRQIRNLLGSFNVPLGIILVVAIERIFFQAFLMPTLSVPPSNSINVTQWINPPQFSSVATASLQAHLYCFAISISLFFILIVEISTNSISVTKTERKLAKDSMFSLNYFLIILIFPIISAFLGWPYVSGAMVRSNSHCIAMAKWSLNNLPGVSPKVIGAAEQRVSGLIVGALVFLSVFLGSALRYIPMAAMYGMFLYMGVMGVRDLQVTRRLKNLFQLRKHWHQHDFLKDFPTWHLLILVIIQLFFISILITLNCISEFTPHAWTPLIFPFFVGLYAFIRGYILPVWPKLNTHLSKMDKKHKVKLFDGKKPEEQIILVKDDTGVNMLVVPKNVNENEDGSEDQSDLESELDKELW